MAAPTDDAKRRRVLVVDDSDELRELYELALASRGYEVKSAPLAETALEIVQGWRPHLILTDLFMPGMGGLELLTRIRSDFAPPVPPVVVISGFPDAEPEALRRGAVRFETKPITAEELVNAVQDVLGELRHARPRSPETVRQRRAATRALGEATLERYLTEDPGVIARMAAETQAAARFMAGFTAVFFLLRGGKLVVAATSSPAYPVEAEASAVLPVITDVVESEGALVLTNASARSLLEASGVRFLVAVPFHLERAVVGALCLVAESPRDFGSAGLAVLEYMARRRSSIMAGARAPHILDESGLLERAAFGAVLAGAVQVASETHGAFGFVLLRTDEVPRDGSLTSLFVNLPARYLMVGVVDPHHVAAFAVARSVGVVKERLLLARRALESRLDGGAAVELTYEDPCPREDAETFVTRARGLLDRLSSERAAEPAFLAIDARRRPATA